MGKRLKDLAAWAIALALLVLAWHLKHPLMYWMRNWETPALLVAGMAGSLVWLGSGRSRPRGLLGLMLLAVALCTLYRELEFAQQRAHVLAAGPEMQAVGAHFIAGFRDFGEIEPLARKGLIGGLYLTRRNMKNLSPAAVTAAIAELQAVRREVGLPPLIVAADQEGGEVSHLSPWLQPMPPLASLVSGGPSATLAERARAYGRLQGADLAGLGVNLNFGPVVDLRPAGPAFIGDRLTLIGRRAIAADPATVVTVARHYSEGLEEEGVGTTFKHFPGLGRVQTDTHLTPAKLTLTPDQLSADWQPFREAGPKTAIMVGHVTLPAVDPDHAASHSRPVIEGVLRGQFGHEGLVITDDLNMGAVYGLGIGRVAGESLAAGADLVLVSYDPDQIFRALYGAAEALARGDIDEARLAASRRRLTAFFADRQPGRSTQLIAARSDRLPIAMAQSLIIAP